MYNNSYKSREVFFINTLKLRQICETCGYWEEEIDSDNRDENQIEHCSCKKIGQQPSVAGYCSEIDELFEKDSKNKTKTRHRTHSTAYRRHMKIIKNKKRMGIINKLGYAPHVGWIKESSVIDMNGKSKGSYIVYPKNSNRRKHLKQLTSRKNRHRTDLPLKGNQYRKVVDVWW